MTEHKEKQIMETIDPSGVEKLLDEMKGYFDEGHLRNLSFRKYLLLRLKKVIQSYEEEIQKALYQDLGKPPMESFMTEIGIIYESIDYLVKHIDSYAKRTLVPRHKTSLLSQGYIYQEPYGVVLIIAPFNYPFQLLMEPLIGAIAAGNVVVVKPSDQAIHTEAIIGKIIKSTFPEDLVRVVMGEKETVTNLTTSNFDYIFFTGSVSTGRIIMENASKNLVPVTLELGGKSPAIVGLKANLKNAARKIVYAKFINAGQTCIAPDYVLVHEQVRDELILEIGHYIRKFYKEDPKASPDYSRIINKKAFKRLEDMLKEDEEYIIYGGETDSRENYIAPTMLYKEDLNLKAMEEEIFGPILPIISYENINQALKEIKDLGKPLALYLFTEDKIFAEKLMKKVSFGGGCVNDVLFHIVSPYLPFGGVGNSGMGQYHGKSSFDTFSHHKSVLKSWSKFNMTLNEPPMSHLKKKMIQKFLK